MLPDLAGRIGVHQIEDSTGSEMQHTKTVDRSSQQFDFQRVAEKDKRMRKRSKKQLTTDTSNA